MEINKMLTLSTNHVREDSIIALEVESETNELGLNVYRKDIYGYFIYLNKNDDYSGLPLPEDLKNCILFALSNDCTVLCLDVEGDEVDELEKYDW